MQRGEYHGLDKQHSNYIEALYLEMFELLFSYARSSLENDSLAEEAVQETFRIACLKPSELCASPNPKGWLVNTLKNVIRNTIKQRNAGKLILATFASEYSSKQGWSEDQLDLKVVYENISQLEEFHLLEAMAVEGRSHKELAQELGISVDACKKRIQRAKKVLKKKM